MSPFEVSKVVNRRELILQDLTPEVLTPGITNTQMDPHWITYIGIVTGLVGALTGIAGSIMGYVAYRRSNEIKRSDRRLDLHKVRNDAHVAIVQLLELLPDALRSREAIMSARGLFKSGAMKKYQDEHAKDLQRATELATKMPPVEVNYDSLSQHLLEKELVELDRTRGWIDALIQKYRASIEQDDRWRSELRADRRAHPPSRQSSFRKPGE